jgi:diguanylate cyclase (GGDEF)-like protein
MVDPVNEKSEAMGRLEKVSACLQAMDVVGAFELARAALVAGGEPADIVGARYWLARCHYVAGEMDEAIRLAAEACTAAAQADEPIWLARSQTLEARCLEAAGESHAALDLVLLALQGLERVGRVDVEARAAQQAAVTALGVVYLQLGDLQPAMDWCERSAALARSLPDQSAFGAAQDTLACVFSAQAANARDANDLAEAERCERLAVDYSTQAVEVAQRLGHVDYETSALLNLAESLTLVGEPHRALGLLEDWVQRHPHAVPRQWAHLNDSLGQVYLALGRHAEAVEAHQRALRDCEADSFRAVITEHLSEALGCCGRWEEALAQYKAFHALHTRISAERAQRSARVAVARLDIERERAHSRRLASSNTELRRRAEDFARQASEDALTGLPNRREVDRLLAQQPLAVSIALIDVDHFKQVNDRFSHAVGDAVLRQLASIMRTSCRPRDLAARLGGEEFVVIYHETAGVEGAAERLRREVEGFDWGLVAPGLEVTVSIGVARSTEAAEGSQLLSLADQRLYEAKRAGRNRVVARAD